MYKVIPAAVGGGVAGGFGSMLGHWQAVALGVVVGLAISAAQAGIKRLGGMPDA